MDEKDEVSNNITKVYIGGLKEDIAKNQLEEAFERFGLVKTVWIARNPQSRGFAFVTYYEPEHAKIAVKELDGTTLFGSRLRVQLSKNEIQEQITRKHHRRSPDSRDRHSVERGTRRQGRRRSRSRDRSRDRSRERLRSPASESSQASDIISDNNVRNLDSSILSETLLLREALLRSALTPYSLLRDPLLLQNSLVGSFPQPLVPETRNTTGNSYGSKHYDRPADYVRNMYGVDDVLNKERMLNDISHQMAYQNLLLGRSSLPSEQISHSYMASPPTVQPTTQPVMVPPPHPPVQIPSSQITTSSVESKTSSWNNDSLQYSSQPVNSSKTSLVRPENLTYFNSSVNYPPQNFNVNPQAGNSSSSIPPPSFPIANTYGTRFPMQTNQNSTGSSTLKPGEPWKEYGAK